MGAYATRVLLDSPDHLWSLTESAGGAADSGASPVTLTVGASVTRDLAGPDAGGEAMGLATGTSGFLSSPNASPAATPEGGDAAFTLSAWVKPVDRTNYSMLITRTDAGNIGWSWWLTGTTGRPSYGRQAGGALEVLATTAPATGVWSHLAVVVTNTGGTTTVTHYLNGAANGTGTITTTWTTVDKLLYVGSRAPDLAFGANFPVACPAIWATTALGAATIAAHAAATTAPVALARSATYFTG